MLNAMLVGPGRVGKKYLEVLSADNRVVVRGVVGSSREKALAVAPPDCHSYGSHQLNQAVESLPAGSMVVVATSEWSHFNELSVLAGKDLHLVVEKPLVSNWSEYVRIRDKLGRHPYHVLPCFTSRFDQRYVAAHALMRSQGVDPVYISSRRNTDYVTASRVFGKIPMPFWIICHDIDIMRWFSGGNVVSLRASSRSPKEGLQAKDFIVAELNLSNGLRGYVESSWCSPPTSGLTPHSDFRVLSEAGSICIDINTPLISGNFKATSVQPDISDLSWQGARPVGSTANMLSHFVDVVTGLQEPWVSVSDAIEALRTSEAIRLSLLRGEEVFLKEIN
jgi:predicted dehydrogenase